MILLFHLDGKLCKNLQGIGAQRRKDAKERLNFPLHAFPSLRADRSLIHDRAYNPAGKNPYQQNFLSDNLRMNDSINTLMGQYVNETLSGGRPNHKKIFTLTFAKSYLGLSASKYRKDRRYNDQKSLIPGKV